MIVDRNKLTWWERLYIPAIWNGLTLTAGHLRRTVLVLVERYAEYVLKKLFRKKYKDEDPEIKWFGVRRVTMPYPEKKWAVPEGYRGAPYLVKDNEGRTKCVSCQLCEFVCPPRAIAITPPGPEVDPSTGNVEKLPREFKIDMLRCIFCGYCQEVCPEEAIFLMKDYSLTGETREEMIYDLPKLLELGGTHDDPIMKWKKKERDARAQPAFH